MSEFLLKEGMSRAYGLYAMSVIKGRALPDIKDGLKPVQRRILYAMYESGYRYNKPFKKSARVVGEVLGKYHPHSDSSVYEAMVHLVQNFVMSVPLVEGQGNFGSIDGDKAASMRYTEARLDQIAEYLLQDYEKDTVPMRDNYDETLQIPVVLPAQFPNLLVNGASGIAVGMATSIPPHNLGEILDGLMAMLDNPDITLEEMMANYIKGPDFPTGGAFYGGSYLVSGYTNGRGKVILRGSCFVEDQKGGRQSAAEAKRKQEDGVIDEVNQIARSNRQSIIIDAIPYQISKPKLIEKITQLVEEGPLEDIADVRDESGKNIRVVLELKKDANAEIIQQRLYMLTNLQVSVSLNMVAIYNEKPELFGLLRILEVFLQFREEVVFKRAEYILNKTLNKAHIISGLVLATSMMDTVIKTIRASENTEDAQNNLMALKWTREQCQPVLNILGEDYIQEDPYSFSIEQAKGILDLRLQKLTKLEQNALLANLQELNAIIQEQKKIIQDRVYRKELMKSEFLFLKDKFAVPRRTELLSSIDNMNEESMIAIESIVIMITAHGYLKRINLEEYRVQNRGGKGKIGHKKIDDPILNLFTTNTHSNILFFTSKGKVFSMKAYEIPEGSSNSRGRAAVNLFKLEEGEKITTILPQEAEEGYLIFVTTNGTIRRNAMADFANIRANGKIAMKLDDDNSLQSVLFVQESDELLLTSSNGNSIRFNVSDIRVFESRSSQGIRGMNLSQDDKIIGATRISPNDSAEILCITRNGYGKRSDFDEYRKIKRGGKGCKTMNINEKTGKIVEAMYVEKIDDIILMTKQGQTIRVAISDIRKTGRVASGVIIMKLPTNDDITQAIRIIPDEQDEE